MAQNSGWLSTGIHIVLIATFCLLWSNYENVNAAGGAEADLEIVRASEAVAPDKTVQTLAGKILNEMFDLRHKENLKSILDRGDSKLTDNEALWMKFLNKGRKEKLTESNPSAVRQAIANRAYNEEKGFQTIAVGVDGNSKTVVIAGNIKGMDFDDGSFTMRGKRLTQTLKIKDAGFQASDYDPIRKLVGEEYADYDVKVLHLSEQDKTRIHDIELARAKRLFPARERPLDVNEMLNAEAHFCHAEMQIRKHFNLQKDSQEAGITIAASKNYCKNCADNLPPQVKEEVAGFSYSSEDMRWTEPEEVIVQELGKTPEREVKVDPVAELDQKVREKVVASGAASCSSGGVSRRKRSLSCNSWEEMTEVDADRFKDTYEQMPKEEREHLLSALDKVGMEKLQGSPSAVAEVDGLRKEWKTTIAQNVMEEVRKGTVMEHLIRGGTESLELEKTAISPKILSESLNQVLEKDLKAFMEQDKKIQSGEIKETESMRAVRFGKLVHRVNMAIIGKDFIQGVVNGDTESVLKMAGLFGADRLLNKAGEMIAARGMSMVEDGSKFAGTSLKVAGPIVASAAVGFSIYSLVGDINQLNSLHEFCQQNHTFQQRVKSDCQLDENMEIASIVMDASSAVTGVLGAVEGVLLLLSVETGPVGAVLLAVDLLLMVGTQIFIAVETVAKISSNLVGGLSGWEKFSIGARTFFGGSPPADITKLIQTKNSYDAGVESAKQILGNQTQFQTYVYPTTRTTFRTCTHVVEKEVREGVSGCTRWLGGDTSYTELHKYEEDCDFQQVFEEDSKVNFQDIQRLNRFRVEPDVPSWGRLECNPNSLASESHRNDPEYVGFLDGYLCYNVIAMTAPDRSGLPVLVDLKDGTDTMKGFPDRMNIFFVGQGPKGFTGGTANDTFVMNSFPFEGQFDGGEGNNTLVLNDLSPSRIVADFTASGNVDLGYTFRNIQLIVGRSKKADTVVTDCSNTYVDLKGGESESNQDDINIPASSCEAKTVFQLNEFTLLQNDHEANGIFIYKMAFGPHVEVKVTEEDKNRHQFVFTEDISTANFSIENGSFVIGNNGKEFKSKLKPSDTVTFMSQDGLAVHYNENSTSFFGLALPTGKSSPFNGLVSYPNQFIFEAEVPAHVNGGDMDDIFILNGTSSANVTIDGGGGNDTLVLLQHYAPNQFVLISFAATGNDVHDETYENSNELKLSNVEHLIGRSGLAEVVTVVCDVSRIDLNGGSKTQFDSVILPPNLSCPAEMTIAVRNFTELRNDATSGDFRYIIYTYDDADASRGPFNVTSAGNATHKYIFRRNSTSVEKVTFDEASNQLNITFQGGSYWSGNFHPNRSHIYLADKVVVQVLPTVQAAIFVQSNVTVNKTGLSMYPNTFLLDETPRNSTCTGGDKDDGFLLRSEKFYGQIAGGKGNNSLVLKDDIWNGSTIVIDGINRTVSVKRDGNESESLFGFRDIQRLFGRVGQSDLVVPGCDTALIDTRHGSTGSIYNIILITSYLGCYFDLDVIIQPNLFVFNEATEGDFLYEGSFEGGKTSIFLIAGSASHQVFLSMDFHQLEGLQIDQGRINITALNNSQFSTDFFIPEGEHMHTMPSIVFHDGLQLKISKQGSYSSSMFGILRNVSSDEKRELKSEAGRSGLIQRYQKTAKATRTNVFMQVEEQFISIGSGGSMEVLTAVPGYERNILVCNDANATVYRIANGTTKVLILSGPEAKGRKLLDLTPLVNGDYWISPLIRRVKMNLEFFLRGVQIIMDGVADNGYEHLESWQVLLRETHLSIGKDENGIYKLLPPTILVEPKEHDNVVLNTPNSEYGMIIQTVHDDPITYELLRHENNLVFTNLFQEALARNVSTVVFQDFYKPDVQDILNAKHVLFEVKPGEFIEVNSFTGMDVPMFEERKSQVSSSSINEVPTASSDEEKKEPQTTEREFPAPSAPKDEHVVPETTLEGSTSHEKDEL